MRPPPGGNQLSDAFARSWPRAGAGFFVSRSTIRSSICQGAALGCSRLRPAFDPDPEGVLMTEPFRRLWRRAECAAGLAIDAVVFAVPGGTILSSAGASSASDR